MSTEPHANQSHAKGDHGTVLSYVIGFILSLIYTLVPYQLVVNKILSGSMLVAVILGIAVLQMAIQLLFFLHLGRGPKPLYNVVFFFATAGVIVITVGASLFIMNNLYHNMSPTEFTTRLAQEEGISQIGGKDTGACTELKQSHIITIRDNQPDPAFITANRCDKLTFINDDSQDYQILFGIPDARVSYGGHFELPVRTDRPETITLNQAGSFTFFEQDNPGLGGRILVSE